MVFGGPQAQDVAMRVGNAWPKAQQPDDVVHHLESFILFGKKFLGSVQIEEQI